MKAFTICLAVGILAVSSLYMSRNGHPSLRALVARHGKTNSSPPWDNREPDPTGAKEMVDRGLEMDRRGRFDDALAEYAKALEVRPDYARAYYDIGVVKGKQGKTSEAIEAYKKAIALDETHSETFYNLGTLLLDARQYDEAEDALRSADRLSPDDLEIMENLGNALAYQRKFEEAIPYFRRILDVAPEMDNVRQSLCYALLQLGRRDDAAKVRAERPSYRPNSPRNCGGDCSHNVPPQ